jgi:hypothetical protein
MKKGASLLISAFIGIMLAIIVFLAGAELLKKTLSLKDDQDMAVYSLRAIATSVSQATTLDSCSSAEIKMTRSYQLKAEGNLLILLHQKLEKDGDGNVVSSETEVIDSITLIMDPDGKLYCQSESRTCANIENIEAVVEETEEGEESSEAIKKDGLIINPSFNREIAETFCICNVGDRISEIYTPVPDIPFIPTVVIETDNFAVFSKKWFSLGCDNAVSQFQGQ